MRQIAPYFGRIQSAYTSAHWWICAGGCNAVDEPKDKPDCVFIFSRDLTEFKEPWTKV